MDVCLLIMITVIDLVSGFYPRFPPFWTTKTHSDITNAGTLQAVSEYIFRHKMNATSPSTALDDFFGTDTKSKTELFKTISTVKNAIADTQEEKRNVAYVHCFAEQIELAHNHVIACREKLQFLAAEKESLDLLRKQVGECLYTIQSFYSNTNWVEMYGGTPYLDFGIKGKTLMTIASLDQDTCKDMPDYDKDCKDNLLVTDRLTSGYHYGRGNTKPARPVGATAGKCSHGGLDDESRKLIAKCGINKETTLEDLSPHFHLHNDAYYAAVAATKNFLIAEDTGILGVLGNDTFDSIFHIKQRAQISLSFAVDYSGSMAGEIRAVREKIIQFVTSTIGSDNEPADYVLSLFNDPASLNKAYVFTNGFDMIHNASAIRVNGGGDCPELAAAGILSAIQLSRKESTVLVFSDADAKDADREAEVRAAALDKNIEVTFLLTGQCPLRRRRETQGRFRRDANFYDSVAAATGGTVYNIEKDEITTVLDEVIEIIFPSSEDIIESYTWGKSQDRTVYVDESIQVLKISIKPAGGEDDADFVYPNGTIEGFTSATTSRIYSEGEIIMSIQKPSAGIYILSRNQQNQLLVNITCQSTITVEGELLQKTGSGGLVSVKGSPVVGQNYTYMITVFNLENATCNLISLVNTSGDVLSDFKITQSTSDIGIVCSAVIDIPNSVFQIKLNATDRFGHQMYRTLPNVYRPASVELLVTASTDDITINKTREIVYEVTNSGSVTTTYDVRIMDDFSSAVPPVRHQYNISAGDRVNGTFTLLPDQLGTFTYTVIVELKETADIKQSISKTLSVIKIERPACTILVTNGTCGPPSLNTANCSKYTWNSLAMVTFSGTELERIFINEGNSVLMKHENLTGVVEGPLAVNMSGDCCTPSVTLSTVDIGGYIAQCQLELSDGAVVESVVAPDNVVDTTVVNTTIVNTTIVSTIVVNTTVVAPIVSNYVLIVSMTVVGTIVFAVIVVGVIYLARRRNMKLRERTENVSYENTLCME